MTRSDRYWLALALAVSIGCALLALRDAYSSEFIAPIDGRLHTFWAERLHNPDLFKGDLLADYFESVAPIGVRAIFAATLSIGIAALTLVKWLPLLLGPITAYFSYRLTRAIAGSPAVACIGSVLLTEAIWTRGDLSSGAARCFLYPCFVAFLYYLLERRWIGIAITTIGASVLYPPIAIVAMGTLAIDVIRSRPAGRQDVLRAAGILAATGLLLVVQSGRAAQFGPVLSPDIARTLPELAEHGRFAFYVGGWAYWLSGYRSGLQPLFTPVPALLGWLLPGLLLVSSELSRRIVSKLTVFASLGVSSLLLFAAAHVLLFRLYEPSRYTMHSARIMLTIGAALVLAVLHDMLARSDRMIVRRSAILLVAAVPLITAREVIGLHQMQVGLPFTSHTRTRSPELIRFLITQPKDTLVATLLDAGNDIPVLAKRPVLAATRFGLPWHLGYYRAVRERMTALIEAQYSRSLADVQGFVRTYGVDLWVIDGSSFDVRAITSERWMTEYAGPAERAVAALQTGQTPALNRLRETCKVFSDHWTVAISGACLLAARPEGMD